MAFGTVQTGYGVGATVTISERVTVTAQQCALVSSRLNSANGAAADAAVPFTTQLASPASRFGLTNVVTCAPTPVEPPTETTGLAATGSTDGGAAPALLGLGALLGGAVLLVAARRRRRLR
ncbi:hypothetical protein A0130_08525 [Leifsonia xyli]|uniref:LPXTG cell wall anchor domain-containing protein n=1 Tax=Leifsonia xyli TaxID=1575 RepID=UPI0007CDF1D2|nr:hypothetical protein A0130_08525 [Leifsonia xyli]